MDPHNIILNFGATPGDPHNVVLNFGVDPASPPPPVPLPPPSDLTLVDVGCHWRPSSPLQRQITLLSGVADHKDRSVTAKWKRGTRADRQIRIPWRRSSPTDTTASDAWDAPTAIDRGVATAWGTPPPKDSLATDTWHLSRARDTQVRERWDQPPPKDRETSAAWDIGRVHNPAARILWMTGAKTDHQLRIAWGASFGAPWIVVPPAVHPPTPEPCPPYCPDPHDIILVFRDKCTPRQPSAVRLVYAEPIWIPSCAQHIPTNIIVKIEYSITRVSDGVPIPCMGVSVGVDIDSWTASFNATIPGGVLPMVDPITNPVEIEITIQGTPWRAIVESYTRSRGLGRDSVTISGRGPAAVLAAPYASTTTGIETATRTAAQIATEALTGTGWALEWQVTDWVVPGGAFSWQNLTVIQRLKRIASAAGAFVQANRTTATVGIHPRYATPPWAWDSVDPDAYIPAGLARDTSSSWLEEPAYNGIHLSGSNQGILAFVRRQGTAGELLAPMMVDALWTAQEAVISAGIAKLASGGKQTKIDMQLPYNPVAGYSLYTPGQLVEVQGQQTYRAVVLATKLTASIDRPSVWQNISLERHY